MVSNLFEKEINKKEKNKKELKDITGGKSFFDYFKSPIIPDCEVIILHFNCFSKPIILWLKVTISI
jgi:hypothetical protein